MYHYLLFFHSSFRWLMLSSLLISIIIAYRGWKRKAVFTSFANQIRHWTATIAHLQLVIGITLYFQSPVVKLPISISGQQLNIDQIFFRYIHIALMLLSVVLITIGSAKAKRMPADVEKYSTMLIWFIIALLMIFLAIPWPFSPLVARPYTRSF